MQHEQCPGHWRLVDIWKNRKDDQVSRENVIVKIKPEILVGSSYKAAITIIRNIYKYRQDKQGKNLNRGIETIFNYWKEWKKRNKLGRLTTVKRVRYWHVNEHLEEWNKHLEEWNKSGCFGDEDVIKSICNDRCITL